MKFYRCKVCGKIVVMVSEAKTPTVCCNEQMTEIIPGITDAATEKHVPVYEVKGNIVTVNVGSVAHPMLPEHSIQWICIETNQGYQIKNLTPGAEPKAAFALNEGESVVAVYEYCNLHGLWKA